MNVILCLLGKFLKKDNGYVVAMSVKNYVKVPLNVKLSPKLIMADENTISILYHMDQTRWPWLRNREHELYTKIVQGVWAWGVALQ